MQAETSEAERVTGFSYTVRRRFQKDRFLQGQRLLYGSAAEMFSSRCLWLFQVPCRSVSRFFGVFSPATARNFCAHAACIPQALCPWGSARASTLPRRLQRQSWRIAQNPNALSPSMRSPSKWFGVRTGQFAMSLWFSCRCKPTCCRR